MQVSKRIMKSWFTCGMLAAVCAAASGCGRAAQSSPVLNNDDIELAMKIRGQTGSTSTAPGAAASVSTGTGWGTFKGVFKFDGPKPAESFFAAGGNDAAVCSSQHPGGKLPGETLVVNESNKGIKNIVIFAQKVSRAYKAEAEVAQPAPFDQKGCLFASHVYVAPVGIGITIKNSDPMAHNTKMEPPGNDPFNQLLGQGGTAGYKFRKEMPAPTSVTCSIHSWMKAYILARNNPYFAVTKDDGSFEIPNVPAGEKIEFRIWHERAGGRDGGGLLEATGEWPKGRSMRTIPVDGVLDLQDVMVAPAVFEKS